MTKVEVKLETETKLVVGISILLDIISITSQDSRKGIFQSKLSK